MYKLKRKRKELQKNENDIYCSKRNENDINFIILALKMASSKNNLMRHCKRHRIILLPVAGNKEYAL